MHILFVLAQPEPHSFNARLVEQMSDAARARGDAVEVSDLYALGFDPVERGGHYPRRADPTYFDVQAEQRAAGASGALPGDVAVELEKLERADLVVLQFPMWWWGPPAMLKGWFDRVLVHGRTWSSTRRFETGMMAGKRAMLSLTCGASQVQLGPDGNEGDADMLVWPLMMALAWCGFDVVPPHYVFGVHGGQTGAAAAALEARQAAGLASLDAAIRHALATPPVAFNRTTDFDAEGRLKPDAPAHSAFIRHRRVLDLG